VDGYVIPAGTNFIIDSYALNIYSDTSAPDNTTYRPDRFLGRRGSELRDSFWRFGLGPRQ
jgi:cytochrome P450